MTAVSKPINWILRGEGVAVFIFALLIYSTLGFSWKSFAILFLIPDIAFLGYLVNKRIGAIAYNTTHSYVGAILCTGLGYFYHIETLLLLGVIWVAHVGFDRMLGYGLKYSDGFGYTHLGLIGKAKTK